MELKWVEDFLCLAQYGSFAKAAKNRNVTQPAFSRRIKALEDWLGAELVNRNTYPASFTHAGFSFLKQANELKKRIEYARAETLNQVTVDKPNIKINTQHSLSEYLVGEIIDHYPEVLRGSVVNVEPSNFHDSVQNFLADTSSLLLLMQFDSIPLFIPNKDVQSMDIGIDYLAPMVGVDKEGTPYFDYQTSKEIPMLSYTTKSVFRQAIEKSQTTKQLSHCNIVYENNVTHSLKNMVLSGHGVAWLPLNSIKKELAQGRLLLLSKEIEPVVGRIRLYRHQASESCLITTNLWQSMNSFKLEPVRCKV